MADVKNHDDNIVGDYNTRVDVTINMDGRSVPVDSTTLLLALIKQVQEQGAKLDELKGSISSQKEIIVQTQEGSDSAQSAFVDLKSLIEIIFPLLFSHNVPAFR